MVSLSAWFENLLFADAAKDTEAVPGRKIVTVIGSGGKTSLIWHLAASLTGSGRRTLVTPTTKMFVPPPEAKLYDRYCNGCPPQSVPGITLAGLFNETNGKLETLQPEIPESIIHDYDLVLIEGDGSRLLPLKAWAEDEPVVPSFTTLTIGVLPLWPLGKPVSENLILRVSLFLALTGAEAGETIKPKHIRALITGRMAEADEPALPGLFAKARGKKVLFFNQVEDDETLKQARKTAELLSPSFRKDLCGIIAGSVREDSLVEL